MGAFVRALKELRGGWLHAEARWINAEVSIRMLEEKQARASDRSPVAREATLLSRFASPTSQAASDGPHGSQMTMLRAELASANAQLQMMGQAIMDEHEIAAALQAKVAARNAEIEQLTAQLHATILQSKGVSEATFARRK